MVWVKFHDKLCKGAKRGLPRAVRFVFMELCLEARPGRGVMSLPVGMPDLDALLQRALDRHVFGTKMRMGTGFGLPNETVPLGTGERTCFWGGWGGSICVIDVDARLSVAYVMNKMAGGLVGVIVGTLADREGEDEAGGLVLLLREMREGDVEKRHVRMLQLEAFFPDGK